MVNGLVSSDTPPTPFPPDPEPPSYSPAIPFLSPLNFLSYMLNFVEVIPTEQVSVVWLRISAQGSFWWEMRQGQQGRGQGGTLYAGLRRSHPEFWLS